jgi:hypothetical protein
MTGRSFFGAAALVGALFLAAPEAQAITAIQNDGLSDANALGHNNSDDMIFMRFTAKEAIEITDLGIWTGADGMLLTDHLLAIYGADGGAPLVSATIARGSYQTDADAYAYVALDKPFALAAGTYWLGVRYPGSGASADDNLGILGGGGTLPSDFASGEGITFDKFAIGPVLDPYKVDPNNMYAGHLELGGNFKFNPVNAAVPEPGSAALLGLGAASLAARFRRRRA